MPRPSPHITFSLSSGISVSPSRSKTTRRSEFEPISITPIRLKDVELRSGMGAAVTLSRDQPRLAPPQRPAPSGQAGIGHEIGVRRKFFVDRYAGIDAVRRKAPALQRVAQIGHHDLVH